MGRGRIRSAAVPAALVRGLHELDVRGTADWDAVVARLRDDLAAAGPAGDTFHEVVELSMVIQQFLLELACRSTGSTKDQIIDATAELLVEMILPDEDSGGGSEELGEPGPGLGAGIYGFARCAVDVGRRSLTMDGARVWLSRVDWSILLRLLASRGRVVTTNELRDAAWGGMPISAAGVRAAVQDLCGKLGDDGRPPTIIRPVKGEGFRLVAEVRMVQQVP